MSGEPPDAAPDTAPVRARLLERRRELEALEAPASEAGATVELDQQRVGRLSRMDALQQQAMAQETVRRREVELRRIDAALERLDAGEYGLCLRCGEPIAEARLHVDPACTTCIACAERLERS